MNNYENRIEWVNEYLDRDNLEDEIWKYFEGRYILVTSGAGAMGNIHAP